MKKIVGITLSLSLALYLSACGNSGDSSIGKDKKNSSLTSSSLSNSNGISTATPTAISNGTSTVDLNKQIVGKTYYLGNPHVETYAFAADGTIKDTWLVDGEEVSETGVYSIKDDILMITFSNGSARLSNAKSESDSLRFYNTAGAEVARFYSEKEVATQEEVAGIATDNFIPFTPELIKSKTVYFTFTTSEVDPRKYASVKFLQSSELNSSHRGSVVSTPYDADGLQIGSDGSRTVDPFIILADGSLEVDNFDNFKLLEKEPTRWLVLNKHISYTFKDGNTTTQRVVEWLLDKPEAIYNQENNISNDTNAS